MAITVGGVIPPGDYSALEAMGVAAIFGPGTVLTEAAQTVIDALAAKLELKLESQ